MERSDVWLLSGYFFRGVAVLFRPFLGPQSTTNLLHILAVVRNQNFIAVHDCKKVASNLLYKEIIPIIVEVIIPK